MNSAKHSMALQRLQRMDRRECWGGNKIGGIYPAAYSEESHGFALRSYLLLPGL